MKPIELKQLIEHYSMLCEHTSRLEASAQRIRELIELQASELRRSHRLGTNDLKSSDWWDNLRNSRGTAEATSILLDMLGSQGTSGDHGRVRPSATRSRKAESFDFWNLGFRRRFDDGSDSPCLC